MADTYWTGASADGNWSTAGNWSGGVPTASDRAIFGKRGGTNSVTTGLDQSAVATVTVLITEGYEGNIGADGDPLISGNTWTVRVRRPTGNYHVYYQPGGSACNAIAEQTSRNSDAFVVVGGTGGACYATGYEGYSHIQIDGTPTLTTVEAMGPGASVNVSNVGATITNIRSYDRANVYTKSKATNGEVADGMLVYDSSSALTWALFEMYGSMANVELRGSGATTFTSLIIKGGMLHRNKDQNPVTITNGEIHAGARLLLGKVGPVTTSNDFDVYGGTIDAPSDFGVNEIIGESATGKTGGGTS